jgi:hypothetical protein
MTSFPSLARPIPFPLSVSSPGLSVPLACVILTLITGLAPAAGIRCTPAVYKNLQHARYELIPFQRVFIRDSCNTYHRVGIRSKIGSSSAHRASFGYIEPQRIGKLNYSTIHVADFYFAPT